MNMVSPTKTMKPPTKSSSPSCVGSLALNSFELQREQITSRITQLETIIANSASGQVVRSKARVELALLKEQHDDRKNNSNTAQVRKDLASVKESSVASKLKHKLEYAVIKAKEDKVRHELDIQQQLVQLQNKVFEERQDAQHRTDEARSRANEAATVVVQAELDIKKARAALHNALNHLVNSQAVKGQMKKNLEGAMSVEEHHDRELDRLMKETQKNDRVIRKKLTMAGLSQKETDIVYDNNDIHLDKQITNGGGGRLKTLGDDDAPSSSSVANTVSISEDEKEDDSANIDFDNNVGAKITTVGQIFTSKPFTHVELDGLLAKLSQHRTDQEDHLQSLQAEVERLNDKCTKSEWAELIKLRQEKANLEDKLQSIQRTLELEQARISTLTADNEHKDAKIHSLQNDIEVKQTKMLELESSNSSQQEKILSLENDNLHRQNTIRFLDLRYNGLEDKVGEKIESLDAELTTLRQQKAEQEDELHSVQRTLELEQARISALIEDKEHQEAKIHSLQNEIEVKQTKVLELESSNSSQQEKILSLENDNLHRQNTIRVLDLRFNGLEDKVGEKIESLDAELTTMRQEKAELILELEQARISTVSANDEHQEVRLRSLEEEIEVKQAKILELESSNSSQQEKILSLDNDNQQHKNTIKMLDLRYNGLEEKVGEKIESLDAELSKLRQQKAEQDVESQSMQRMLELEQARISTLTADNEYQEARIHSLENDCEVKQTKMLVLERSNFSQREKILSLENDILHHKNTIKILDLRYNGLEEQVDETIESINSHVKDIKKSLLFWHKQTSVMHHELHLVQEKRYLEESNMQRLERRVQFEDLSLENTQNAVKSLGEMKVLLEYRLMVAKKEEKVKLEEMMVDTAHMLKEKAREVKAIQAVRSAYDTSISDKRQILFLHDVIQHAEDTVKARSDAMTSSIWAPSNILLACIEQESKVHASRNDLAHNPRFTQALIGSDPRDRSNRSDDDDIAALQKKLAEITAEKDEYKTRAKLQEYQLTCRSCSTDLRYIGKTRRSIQTTVEGHFEEIWAIVQQGNDGAPQAGGSSFAKSALAAHIAIHCEYAATKDDAMQVFVQSIRVQVYTKLTPKKKSGGIKKIGNLLGL